MFGGMFGKRQGFTPPIVPPGMKMGGPNAAMQRGAQPMSPEQAAMVRQMAQGQAPKKKGGMFSQGGKGWDALNLIGGMVRDASLSPGQQGGHFDAARQGIMQGRQQKKLEAKQAQQQAQQDMAIARLVRDDPKLRELAVLNREGFANAMIGGLIPSYSDTTSRDRLGHDVRRDERDFQHTVDQAAQTQSNTDRAYGRGVFESDRTYTAGRDDENFDRENPGASLVSIQNQSSEKGETAFQQGRGRAASDAMTGIMDRATVAQSTLADAGMMKALLKQVDYTGFGGNTLLSVQRMAQSLGFETEGLGAKEAVSRLTSKLGLALKSDLPGPMSDGDRKFLLDIPPNLATTKEGNAALVFMMTKRAEADIAMEQSLLAANPQTKEEYEAWENEYRRTTPPLFSETTKQKLLAAIGK